MRFCVGLKPTTPQSAAGMQISPFISYWYYEQLASLMGDYDRTQDSVRLFIEPGMDHCSGGISPNSFDTLQALDRWVTKGVAPEGILATAPTSTLPSSGRTMPLCKFPEEASYSGSGNVYSAANWSCDPSDTGMLAVGATGLASGADTATALQPSTIRSRRGSALASRTAEPLS